MSGFNKREAVKMWVAEHYPKLKVRCADTDSTAVGIFQTRLGWVVIGVDADILELMGTVQNPDRPLHVVEVNFDITKDVDGRKVEADWFYSHNQPFTGKPMPQESACIFDPDYFAKLEKMLKHAELI